MRINHRFLYWGLFLVAIGGVLVAADLAAIDGPAIADALRFWPIAIIAVGLGLVLRRSRLSLPAGMLAAAVPGLVIGGAFAVVPRLAVDCGATGTPSVVALHEGAFERPARVSVSTGCGELDVSTAPGSSWRLEADNAATRPPIVDAAADSLSIDAGGGGGWHGFDRGGRDAWRLTLPTSELANLTFDVNAGIGKFDLAGAQVDHLDVTTNAAQASVDLTSAMVARFTGQVNAGMTSLRLSSVADLDATVSVNAGALQVCAPAGIGIRLSHTGALSGTRINGLEQTGQTWESPDYASSAHHAVINVAVHLGSVEINPIGGCK